MKNFFEITGWPLVKTKKAHILKRALYFITFGLLGCLYEKLKPWQN